MRGCGKHPFFRSVGGEDMNTKLTFIVAHAHDHAIRLLCRVLVASRSWFHAWQRTAADRAKRASRFEVLVGEIRAIFEDSKQRYGAPRIHADLQAQGHHVSRKTVAKLMKLRGIAPASTQAAHARDHGQPPFLCDSPEPAEPQLQDHGARHHLARGYLVYPN